MVEMRMKSRSILFIGPVGLKTSSVNGASMKNRFLVSRLRQFFHLQIVDTEGWRRRPWLLFRLLWYILINLNGTYVISTNNTSTYRLLRILNSLPGQRELYYWVIGGSIAAWIQEKKVESAPYRQLKMFIVEGQSMKRTLESCGFERVLCVPNFKEIPHLLEKKRNPSSVFRFVYLSRILPEKGCDDILDAVERLIGRGYGNLFTVDFWGPVEASYASSFFRRVDSLPQVAYRGILDLCRPENYAVLQDHDVMLFPTRWHGEGFPGVVIDAYIAGLPVIATDWNMNRDVLEEGRSGWFVPVGDVGVLADTMAKRIEDRATVARMSAYCQQEAMKYDVNTVLSERLFRSMGLY